MSITVNPIPENERGSCPKELAFGAAFADHMFTQLYDDGLGWHDAVIGRFHDLKLSPAAAVLHYGQEIFEGMKAYRRPDGKVSFFRPDANIKRFNRSAARMVMPEVDEAVHLEALEKLISLDQKWVPSEPGSSLYIRPTMIATSPKLGLGAAKAYMHFIITSPVGPYFKEGLNPVSVYISDKYRRAVVGGVGEAKTGGNYAASLLVSEDVASKGYTQVLWLDAVEGRYAEEVGAMNVCFVYGGERVVTPSLSGSILPGITRDSVLKLAPHIGFEVEEARLDVNTILADIKAGKITEVFGCGTAAVISPIGRLCFKGEDYIINDNKAGPVAKKLYDSLTGIQYGTAEDPFNWVHVID
ncbi:branched-chain amino acid aminotransferase [Kordiimonas pumila]|uniref:Probable branched-chain-amino-acid aminotransferase n=1 Tax=Kordiimonas pumila TaxID=2161677 RepID=A0ABV7D741_9PROT|nr:branched-chain amino acid aminotransferase [Kordiimonas pumila]